jgi:hypothetical protein
MSRIFLYSADFWLIRQHETRKSAQSTGNHGKGDRDVAHAESAPRMRAESQGVYMNSVKKNSVLTLKFGIWNPPQSIEEKGTAEIFDVTKSGF